MKHGTHKYVVAVVDVVLNSLLQKMRKGHVCARRFTKVCFSWGWLQLSCHMPQEQRLNQNISKTEAMAVSLLSTLHTKYFDFGT